MLEIARSGLSNEPGMTSKLCAVAALVVLTACAASPPSGASQNTHVALPNGATAGANGYATLLAAPPSPLAPHLPRAPSLAEDDERLRNPDEAAMHAAEALHRRLAVEEAGNYVGRRIVRDPRPRIAFQFRQSATATLARYTRDPRFAAREGGVPAAELQPIIDEWFPLLSSHRLTAGGSVQDFDGVVALDMTIDESSFREIAAEQGWAVPERLRLTFGPLPNPRSVDPSLAPLVRVFARSDRLAGVVPLGALSGRIILRDGCFKLAEHVGSGNEPLVLFDRDAELIRDAGNYMALREGEGPGRTTRIGEPITWAGPRGADEADAGVRKLREHCGGGPIIPVGMAISSATFPPRD